MQKLYSISVRGKTKNWSFDFYADPKYVKDWRNDGLQVDEVVNSIPQWYVDMGFPIKLWCFVQDVFRK